MREVRTVRKRRNNPFLQGIVSKVRRETEAETEGEGEKETRVCVGRDILKDTCASAAQSRLFLSDPMDRSTAGFPVLHRFSVYANSCPSNRGWCPSISSSAIPFRSCLQSFPTSGTFPMSQTFPSGDHSFGVSAAASVLSMNIQDWVPLGWTGLTLKNIYQLPVEIHNHILVLITSNKLWNNS